MFLWWWHDSSEAERENDQKGHAWKDHPILGTEKKKKGKLLPDLIWPLFKSREILSSSFDYIKKWFHGLSQHS